MCAGNEIDAFFKQARYCRICNYAIATIEIEMARYDYPCPNCNIGKISRFYSFGSLHHEELVDRLAAGELVLDKGDIPPPPLPTKTNTE